MLHDGRREKKSTQYNDASKNSARHATTAAVSAFLGYLLRFSIFASSIPRLKTHARSVHTSCVETHALFLPFIATQHHGSSPGSTHPPSPARQRHSKVTLKGQFKGRSWMSHGEGLFLGAPRARARGAFSLPRASSHVCPLRPCGALPLMFVQGRHVNVSKSKMWTVEWFRRPS